jgi:hypothetical protein
MAIGVYLICSRFLVGGSAVAVWSAYLAGSAVLVAGTLAISLPQARWVFAIRILSGTWLVGSPFALGYGGVPAASALIAGALLVVTGEPLRALFGLAASARAALLVYDLKTLSPHQVSSFQGRCASPGPELLARRIVECSSQIRVTMLEDPSEDEIETCIVGYRSCVDDMVTLAAMVGEEREKSGPLRRLKLRMVRGEALHSLACARETLRDAVGTARVRL